MPAKTNDDQLENIASSLQRIASVAEFFKIFTIVILIISIFAAFVWGIGLAIASTSPTRVNTPSSSKYSTK